MFREFFGGKKSDAGKKIIYRPRIWQNYKKFSHYMLRFALYYIYNFIIIEFYFLVLITYIKKAVKCETLRHVTWDSFTLCTYSMILFSGVLTGLNWQTLSNFCSLKNVRKNDTYSSTKAKNNMTNQPKRCQAPEWNMRQIRGIFTLSFVKFH